MGETCANVGCHSPLGISLPSLDLATTWNRLWQTQSWINMVGFQMWAGRTKVNKFPCDLMFENENLQSSTQMRLRILVLLSNRWDPVSRSSYQTQMGSSILVLLAHTNGIHYSSVFLSHTVSKICSLLYSTALFYIDSIAQRFRFGSLESWHIIALCLL